MHSQLAALAPWLLVGSRREGLLPFCFAQLQGMEHEDFIVRTSLRLQLRFILIFNRLAVLTPNSLIMICWPSRNPHTFCFVQNRYVLRYTTFKSPPSPTHPLPDLRSRTRTPPTSRSVPIIHPPDAQIDKLCVPLPSEFVLGEGGNRACSTYMQACKL